MRPARTCSALLLAIAAVALVPCGPSHAAKTSQIYPELAERKGSLGRTLVLVDVVVVDDIAGNVEKIKLGRSSTLAHLAATSIRESLAGKGIEADSVVVASIGMGLNLLAPFQSDSILASGPDDTSQVIHAPFHVDSLLADAETRAAWRGFLESGWNYSRKKGKPPGYLGEPVTLGSGLGYDTVGLLHVVSWGIPATKQILWALAGASEDSKTSYLFLLADAKSGQVLWSERGAHLKSANDGLIAMMVRDCTEELP